MTDDNLLVELARTFAGISLIAIGGISAVMPEVYRQVVDVHGWMSAAELANLYALGQASPGPNGMVVGLVGWQLAGLAGFAVAVLAANGPPALLAFGMARLRRRLGANSWLGTAQAGMVPIAIGLFLANGLLTAQAADETWLAVAVTVITTLVVWRTNFNPLWLLAAGGLLGLLGA
ncbi:MAG: chromate transporter [Chloroflexota bacterium]|nr:chromate transporter [Chloroflexota bacterium]